MKQYVCKNYDHNLDVEGPEVGRVNSLPEHLRPTEKMLNNFRKNCVDMGIMEEMEVHDAAAL